ncbi:hypothetical protein D3C87_1030680 [compost metagenome]|jgi:hypothetical protein
MALKKRSWPRLSTSDLAGSVGSLFPAGNVRRIEQLRVCWMDRSSEDVQSTPTFWG